MGKYVLLRKWTDQRTGDVRNTFKLLSTLP